MRISIIASYCICFFFISSSGRCQIVRQSSFDNYEMLYNADAESDAKYDGTPYIDDSWKKVDVIIQGNSKRYRKSRFNILKGYMEIKNRGEIRIIDGATISSFRWRGSDSTSTYYYRKKLLIDNSPVTGLFRISNVKELKLMSCYYVTVRKASKQNPLLSGIENNDRIIIKTKHYVIRNNIFTQVSKIKDLQTIFPSRSSHLKKHIKEQRIDLKSHEGILSVLDMEHTDMNQ